MIPNCGAAVNHLIQLFSMVRVKSHSAENLGIPLIKIVLEVSVKTEKYCNLNKIASNHSSGIK